MYGIAAERYQTALLAGESSRLIQFIGVDPGC